MRIDQRDLAGESPVRIAARPHHDILALGNGGQIALRDIDHGPDMRMIRDAEQHVAGHDAHAVGHVAFKHDAVSRRSPCEVDGTWRVRSISLSELGGESARFSSRWRAPCGVPDVPENRA